MNKKINKSLLKGICAGAALMASTTVFAEELYTVDGNKVDEKTMMGFKIYKRAGSVGCIACHGPTAEGGGSFPNLLESIKKVSKADFIKKVKEGGTAMPPQLDGVMKVVKKSKMSEEEAFDALYGYLKGRSDGAIPSGNLKKIK